MPIFQQFDPLTQASQTIGDYSANQEDKRRQALQESRQAKLDAQAQSNADRTYALNVRGADREDKKTNADIDHMTHEEKVQDAELKIQQAREAREAKMADLDYKLKQKQITAADYDIAAKKLENEQKSFELGILDRKTHV